MKNYLLWFILALYNHCYDYILYVFFWPVLTGGFSLKVEWQQVSRTLLSTLAVVWIVLILSLISSSSVSIPSLLGTIPKIQPIIGLTVIFIVHRFFCSQERSRHLSLFLLSLICTMWSAEMVKYTRWQILFFFLILLGLIANSYGTILYYY